MARSGKMRDAQVARRPDVAAQREAERRANVVTAAKAKISEALAEGAQFNPAGVSEYTRDTAVANQTREGLSNAAKTSIQLGEKGSARAMPGMQNEFTAKGKLDKVRRTKGK